MGFGKPTRFSVFVIFASAMQGFHCGSALPVMPPRSRLNRRVPFPLIGGGFEGCEDRKGRVGKSV